MSKFLNVIIDMIVVISIIGIPAMLAVRCCDWVVNMAVVKRRQQKLKYYRYCLRKARELMRSELRKCEVLAGRMKNDNKKRTRRRIFPR